MNYWARSSLRACPEFAEYSSETADAVLGEAARFAEMVLEPLCKSGDREGAHWTPDGVTMPAGFRDAYQQFCDNGWPALRSKAEFGGQNVPSVLGTAVEELWAASNLAFKLCPMLTQGAIEAIQHFGTPQQKQLYLPKMVSGQWTGTMNLTEPQAGSDLAQVRTRATPTGPNYRIYGQKIFITYGEHDLAENIVHMVLARIDGAPPGVRGISLFIVPKFWVNADGSPGARNDVNCASIEHKLGIHASPTCVMMYGENEGALGLLVGEPNHGLEYMFVMMNAARLSVGLEGYAQGERAFQQAADWARTRVQGKPPVSLARIAGSASMGTSSSPAPIIGHPDVKRMLLGMKSTVEACRAMALYAAQQLDLGAAHPDEAGARGCAGTRRPAHSHRQGLLHRERHRDRVGRHPGARRHGLRRGNGRSADASATRASLRFTKAPREFSRTISSAARSAGTAARRCWHFSRRCRSHSMRSLRFMPRRCRLAVRPPMRSCGCASRPIRCSQHSQPRRIAPWPCRCRSCELCGFTIGGWLMARAAVVAANKLAAGASDREFLDAKLATAHFYATQVLPQVLALEQVVCHGSEAVVGTDATLI